MPLRSLLVLTALLFAAGCDCSGPSEPACESQADCAASAMCLDGVCVSRPDGGPPMDATSGEEDGGVSRDAGPCGPTCARCRFGTCVPDLGTCATHDDCPGDSYCSADGECIPYGVPPDVTHDPMCQRPEVLGGVTPVVQCQWSAPGPGDIEPRSKRVYTAPMVADLNLDEDPGRLQPSIVITTWYASPATEEDDRIGMLRIFDGRTCEEQLQFGGPDDLDNRPAYGSQWAIADLDGDVPSGGRPELVGLHRTPGTGVRVANLYAIKIDVTDGVPSARRLWYGRDCTTDEPVRFSSSTNTTGPSVFDLNDDGDPEILFSDMVFDSDGCLLNAPLSSSRPQQTAADADGDGRVELVSGTRVAEWDPAAQEWVDEPYFVTGAAHHIAGHVAVVDLGDYSNVSGDPLVAQPEIVVVAQGTIRALALDGSLIFGPVRLHADPAAATDAGGPPTASDFDGDGQAELAASGRDYYVVFDPDCVDPSTEAPERPGGRCDRSPAMSGMPPGVLWAQAAREVSSGVTGSSVFDFNGDGSAEAVYRDECYLRVYDGATGEVLFSAPASSGTGMELSVIADVDGDFATEIVVPRTLRGGCPSPDPLFPESGPFVQEDGFVIYRDPEDRWASSRPIWNQYAYSITHVTDDGRVPRTSEWRQNWTVPGLNNFRQNTQGETGLLNIADLTVVLNDIAELSTATLPAELTLSARVCNRGTNPVQDGVLMHFAEDATLVCETATTRLLLPGECEEVTCVGNVTSADDLIVRVDPNDDIADCRPGNNEGVAASRLCIF